LFLNHPATEKIFALPGLIFGPLAVLAFVLGFFSNTVGGILHLCNSVLVFSHFWMIVNFLGHNHWVWTGCVVLEIFFFISSVIITILDLIVACRDEKDVENYEIQQDEAQ
jgi:hypothetical protein